MGILIWLKDLPSHQLYLLNALVLFIVVTGIARLPVLRDRARLRIALLSLVLLLDSNALLWFDCSPLVVVSSLAVAGLSSMFFPKGQTAALHQSFGRLKFAIYVLSVFTLAALVYIYLPITTFLTSPGELDIHLEFLLTENAPGIMFAVYVASLLYGLAPSPRIKSVFALLALLSLVLGLIYSYIYPFGYPMMNGLLFEQIPISTFDLALRGVGDVVTVTVVAFLLVYVLIRFGGKSALVGIILINISLIIVAGLSIARSATGLEGQAGNASLAVSRPIELGKEKNNVLVIMLDRLMGGFVEAILEREPKIAASLDGFVWYPKTISAGWNSISGVHPLLGGYDYMPREMNKRNQPIVEVSAESFAILPFNFSRNGYHTNFVNPRGLGFTVNGDCSYLEMTGVSCSHTPAAVAKNLAAEHDVQLTDLAKSSYADLLVLLGLMRETPYITRAILSERGPWKKFMDHSAGTTFIQWAELKSLPDLSTTDSDQNNLNIFFNMLPHESYFLNENCTPRPSRLKLSRKEISKRGFRNLFELQHFIGSRCSLRLVADYLDWMKERDVYDNTMIIIVSDHGISGPAQDRSSRAVAGGTTHNRFVRSRSVLLVKRREAHGPVRISEDFMPNAEVPRIVCEEIGGCVNPYLADKSIAAHGRDIPFVVSYVPWQFNLQERNALKILESMVLMGRDPYDIKAWRQKGKATQWPQ
jgi:hypothetical protein